MHAGEAKILLGPSRSAAASLRLCGLFAALGLLALGAPSASACDLWWACGDRSFTSRQPPRAHGYRPPARAGRWPAWAYGYSNPARAYGYAFAAWPSVSIPRSRWYLDAALQVPNANAVGLTAPVASAQGLLEGGLPAGGPSLFGAMPPTAAGYHYGPPRNGYYSAPASAYRLPPADTPSWWVEPRRRR